MNREIMYINLLNLINQHNDNNVKLDEIKNQYINLLKNLTDTSDISQKIFMDQIKLISNMGNIIIAIEGNIKNFKIIGSGTIIIEPKIIHNASFVAHIEDIVIHPDFRGLGIAKKIIFMLKDYSKLMNCYKIILNCKDEYNSVYEKCEFIKKGNEMAYYF